MKHYPIRTFKGGRSLTDVRSLDWLQKQRSEEIEQMTLNYNNQFDGRPIFSSSQVLLLTFGMSVSQYLFRELTEKERKQHFFRGGKYNNYKRLRV